MPNRIIKESICTSDDINELTSEQEVFFYRLIVNCDDYGRFDARADIIRSRLYPLKVDKVKIKDIESWLAALINKKMVMVYDVDGKKYLQITNWGSHQQIRAKKSKFPAPDINNTSSDIICNQEISNDGICPRESESESIYENPNPNPYIADVVDAYNQICESLPKVQSVTEKRKGVVKQRAKEHSVDTICQVFKKANSSDFLSGRNGKWSGCNFDWIMTQGNFVKVLEGTYDNKDPSSPTKRPVPTNSVVDFFKRRTSDEPNGRDEHRGFTDRAATGCGDFRTIDVSISECEDYT